MNIIGIAVITLALVIPTTGYAEVYKWVDENGVTHYGATPPKSHSSTSNTEPHERKVTRILHREERLPAFQQIALYGKWWGRLDNWIFELEFKRDEFELLSYDSNFQPHRSLFAAGRYEQGMDETLTLHYRYNRERPHLVGKQETLLINVISAHQWHGQVAGKNAPIKMRKQIKRSSPFDSSIYGAWIDTANPHARYRFSLGSLIHEQSPDTGPSRRETVSIANYFWDDPEIRVEPIISQRQTSDNVSDLEEYWELESLTDRRLRIKNLNTGTSMVLKRD